MYSTVCSFVVFLSSTMATTPAAPGEGNAVDIRSEGTGEGGPFVADVFSFGESHRVQIDLNGVWEFRRDPDDRGKEQGWHEGRGEFAETLKIPGAPQAQGFGEPNDRQRSFFMEPFWVRRAFLMPKLGLDKRVWLRIGGILPAAEVYVNGSYVGYTKSSRTQQRVDITSLVKPAAENLLAIKVCDFPQIRLDGIWEMSECAKQWTGVYRPITCEITDRVSVIDAYVQPKLSSGSVRVDVALNEPPTEPLTLVLQVKDGANTIGRTAVALPKGKDQAEAEVKLKNLMTWSPEHPKLYTLDISLRKDGRANLTDRVSLRFGMREMTVKGTKFYLNGKPIFLRFFGENQYYPKTLCPPADKNWYLSRLKRARAYGMNGAKGCVEILPQEYVEAADEAGIMLIQEMPFGLSGLRANRYTIDDHFRAYYARELDGLVRQSRNHASVVAYSMSSEMSFDSQTQESFDFFSRDLVRQTRELAPHALVIDCTGYLNSEDTKKGKRDTDFYASIIPTWMKEILDETAIHTDRKHPTILHEYNWWSCYPDPADRAKYADMQMKPFWLDRLVRTARENGQEDLLPIYRRNSLWLQALGRKDGIEYTRRNPDAEGYILWLLVDFGQYAEGLFDDFWNPKNVSARAFLESNGDTVVVLAKEGDRCLRMAAPARIPLAVSHYGEEILRNCTLRWQITKGSAFQEGELPIAELKQGELTQAGSAAFDLPTNGRAYKFRLRVGLYHKDRLVNTNDWSFWAFPEVRKRWRPVSQAESAGSTLDDGTLLRLSSARFEAIPENTPLVIADAADEPLAEYLERGGKCLLLVQGAAIENTICYTGSRSFYRNFRTIPWNAGTSGNSGTVIRSHPALEAFPHEEMCDLQFVWMIRDVLPMEFSPLRTFGVEPIIRAIDHYAANRNNAYMLEFKVGKGKVLATTLGVLQRLDEHIEAGYLLECLAAYARGASFAPAASLPREEFLKLFSIRAD